MVQELRVVRTGVQLLSVLLLTRPFPQGFDILDNDMRIVCLAIVASSVASTVLPVASVGMHRLLFAATAAKLWWPRRMDESAQSGVRRQHMMIDAPELRETLSLPVRRT